MGKKKEKGQDSALGQGLGLFFAAILVFASFIIVKDKNLLGPFGEIIARVIYFFIGKAGYMLPFIMVIVAISILQKDYKYSETRFGVGFTLLIAAVSMIMGLIFKGAENEIFVLRKVDAFYGGGLKSFWASLPSYLHIMDADY